MRLFARVRRFATALRASGHPWRFLLGSLLWHSRLAPLVTFPCGRFRLRFHRTALSFGHFVNPRCRADDEDFLALWLRPGDQVVDVGANIGTLALPAAALVGPGGHVAAIEAHPRTSACLAANVALNGFAQVRVWACALGAERGTVGFSDQRTDDQNQVTADGRLRVEVHRLDDLLGAGQGPIALLKLDVEGYELPVLQGAPATLQRTACVYFEVCEALTERYGYQPAAVVRLLQAAGFTVLRRTGDSLTPVGLQARTAGLENWLAVRDAAAFAARTGWALPPTNAGDTAQAVTNAS